MGSVLDQEDIMICIWFNNNFDLLGLAPGLVHPIIMVCGQMGYEKTGKLMKNKIGIAIKRNFRWPGENLTEIVGEAGKL